MLAWVGKHPWLALGAVIGLILALAVGTSTLVKRTSCSIYGSATERETRYSFAVGCMVKTQHGWVPRHELRSAAE